MGWVEIKKNAMSGVDTAFYVGDSYRIQTCNLLIRSQMLYSVELRSHHWEREMLVTPTGFKPVTF